LKSARDMRQVIRYQPLAKEDYAEAIVGAFCKMVNFNALAVMIRSRSMCMLSRRRTRSP
jgi:GTP cyclohydrolase I